MPPRWSSYEPHPSGRGYTLFDDAGQAATFATTPDVEALVKAIPPRRGAMSPDALADAGAGGGGGSGGAPQAPAPPPEPAGPPLPPANYSTAGGPVAAGAGGAITPAATDTPPPAAAPPGRALPPRAPPLGGAGGGDAPAGPRALSQRETDEEQLRRVEDMQIKRAGMGSPIVRHDAAWLDKGRTIEGKVIDPNAIAEWESAAAAEREASARVTQEQAKAQEKAMALDASKADLEAKAKADQDFAAEKAAKDDREFEDSIDAERRKLADPNHYWNSLDTGKQVTASIVMALQGIGQVLAGKEPKNVGDFLDEAIARDTAARGRNIGLLGQARERAQKRYGDETVAREKTYQASLRAVDDQIKRTLTAAQNPIVQEVIQEQAVKDPFHAVASKLTDRLRAMGHAIAPEQILGPPQRGEPEMVTKLREQTRYLGAEAQQAQQRLQIARERLGLADKMAQSMSVSSAFIPAHTTGGGGDPLKAAQRVLEARIARGDKAAEMDLKRLEAGGKAEERGEQRAAKEGARTFAMTDPVTGAVVEYQARPGTPDTEMTEVRKQGASLSAVGKEAHKLKKVLTIKDKAIRNKELRLHTYTMGAAANVATGNGAMTKDNEDMFNDLLGSVIDGGGSEESVDAVLSFVDNLQRGKAQQIGAKPKAGK